MYEIKIEVFNYYARIKSIQTTAYDFNHKAKKILHDTNHGMKNLWSQF
jgi:hypothetical protein